MRDEIRSAHTASAMAAIGGRGELNSSWWGRLGQILKHQYAFLSNFSRQIGGGLPLTARIGARAALYIESARATYHSVERLNMRLKGKMEELSVLGIADHCDGCLSEAAKGWRPINTLLPIGSRDCRARCRCHFEYR